MPDIDALFSDRTQLARIRAEADFGLRELQGLVAKLSHGSRVLEIGCGTGFLLTRLNALRPDLHLTGLEPLGQGFQGFEQTLDRIQAAVREIEIVRLPIEQFSVAQDHERFDLIFSVNVFEHVDDWEQAVKRSMATLSPNGQMVILCPNYAVPYEPHFAIPIIGGPTLTRKLFGRHIEAV
ncbi:MAG: class I SAM-dependent methyltransferase, partial [Alphaproteobacteria bacterium]|nr:class I SAM-dependent methyltransferase [Alphaproteobacteria bacterium]